MITILPFIPDDTVGDGDDSSRDLALDGQLRFTHSAIRGSRAAAMLVEDSLADFGGIIKARANARTGAILVIYDVQSISPISVLEHLGALLDAHQSTGT